jgi:hypothetical protein
MSSLATNLVHATMYRNARDAWTYKCQKGGLKFKGGNFAIPLEMSVGNRDKKELILGGSPHI